MNCANCGTEVPDESAFCHQCAAPIAHPAMPAASKRPARRRVLPIAAAAGALAMAAGVVIVVLLVVQPFGGDQESTPDNGVTAPTGFPDASPTVGPLEQEDEPRTPFERLLSFVPLERPHGSPEAAWWPCLVDWDEFFKSLEHEGLRLDDLEALPEEERQEAMRRIFALGPNATGIEFGDREGYRNLLGFDPLRPAQKLSDNTALSELVGLDIWLGEFDVQRTTRALTDAGYKPREEDGVAFLSFGEAWELKYKLDASTEILRPIDPPALRFYQIWLTADTFVAAADPTVLAASVRASRGEIPSFLDRPDFRLILDEMAPAPVLCITAEASEMADPLDNVAYQVPDVTDHERAKQLLRQQLQNNYPEWGRLPAPEILVFGYNYSPLEGDIFSIGLFYGDETSAAGAEQEMAKRLAEYEFWQTRQQFCENVSTRGSGGLVVTECVGGVAQRWVDAWTTQDILFLVDDLRGPQPQ